VRVTLPPEQNVVGPDVEMDAVTGAVSVTTVAADVPEHPAAFVPVTVKVPDAETVMVGDVEPFDQRYDASPAGRAVSVTEPPSQKVVGPLAEMDMTGAVLTVTTVAEDCGDVHPDAFVPVTVYEPEPVAVMDCVVAYAPPSLYHW